MGLQLISPPTVEPVSLEELKEFLRVDAGDTSQDGTIQGLAVAGRYHAETFTKRRFVKQGWALFMDFFPGYIDLKLAGAKVSSPFVSGSNAVLVGIRYAIVLPFPPHRSILTCLSTRTPTATLTTMHEWERVCLLRRGTGNVSDLKSQPARLTPPFGQMWPGARVVVNAIEVDFTTGYAEPIVVNTSANSPTLVIGGSPPGYTLTPADVGRPIYIPGAGPGGLTLSTIIQSLAGEDAVLRDQATTAVNGKTALLVNRGIPGHWELIRTAIKMWTAGKYYQRMPDADVQANVEALLYPARDLRF